jgi:hypothetical protein
MDAIDRRLGIRLVLRSGAATAVLLLLAALLDSTGCAGSDDGNGARRGNTSSGNQASAGNSAVGTGGTSSLASGNATSGSGGASIPVLDTGETPLESCEPLGSTRVCCDVGVQTCEGIEFPAWGPCLDNGGATVSCDEPCGTAEFHPGCDAGVPPPPPPPPDVPDAGQPPPPDECGPGMVCKPGAKRYCDIVGAEWSEAVCGATGQWGPCVATNIPAAADGAGCAQDDYAPELCCPVAVICCQDNPNGPFLDFGSGACAAIGCP